MGLILFMELFIISFCTDCCPRSLRRMLRVVRSVDASLREWGAVRDRGCGLLRLLSLFTSLCSVGLSLLYVTLCARWLSHSKHLQTNIQQPDLLILMHSSLDSLWSVSQQQCIPPLLHFRVAWCMLFFSIHRADWPLCDRGGWARARLWV